MTILATVVATLLIAPAVFLFLDGFTNPAKVDSAKNEAMKSFLTIIGKIYYPINRLGAWLRRILSGVRRA